MTKVISWKVIIGLGLCALAACGVYLLASYSIEGIGFPLDDAWIHQAFARNFANNLTWSFQNGTLSGGSTGPLWGMTLALIHWVGLPPIWGTYVLGFLALWAAAVAGYLLVLTDSNHSHYLALAAGLLVCFEWHIVWAALSGMETILLILVTLVFFVWLFRSKENWWFPGTLIGLSIWIRPDGITLIGPAVFVLYFQSQAKGHLKRKLLELLGGLLALAIPYFLFNWQVAGDLWPNTFYAKQAEYSVILHQNILTRVLNTSKQFFTGAGILLTPGILIAGYLAVKERKWPWLALILWVVGYIGIYTWRLPVSYQHGRYIMPAMPAGFLIGLLGLSCIIKESTVGLFLKLIKRTWVVSTILVTIIFLILGSRAYGMDVAVINTEMVKSALWIRDNTSAESTIAAHDIGALGYFGERRIIDLAGLVSPEVIPIIRNETALADFLDQKEVDYLMTFPSWYPQLVEGLDPVFRSDSPYSIKFGQDNMIVFLWREDNSSSE